jgi:hypothetical protein
VDSPRNRSIECAASESVPVRLNPTKEHPLNAESTAQARLLDLQDRDTRLTQLQHRARTLAEAAQLAELDARLVRVRDQIVAAEAILGDLQRDLARAEADVEQVRERSRRDNELLNSGSIGDPKQLQNLQHELGSLARRQSDLEDAELEVMERVEGAEAAVTTLKAERDALQADRGPLQQLVDDLNGGIAEEEAQVRQQRDQIAGTIPADLLSLYEKIRADHAGVGAAHLHRGQCEGCRLQLPPQELQRLRAADPNEVIRCEECRRILVRTEESGLGA